MGTQKCKTAVTLLVVLLSLPTICYADTAVDVYEVYGVDYEITYPDSVVDTINSYNYAKRYIAMYRYVAESEYDKSILEKRIDTLESKLKDIESKLSNGYNLSLDEIYALEDEYVTTSKNLSDAKSALVEGEVECDTPDASNTPTYEEYMEAMQEKSRIKTEAEVGSVKNLTYPVTSASLVSDKTDNSLLLDVAFGTTVTALFNGTVAAVDDSSITLNHHNGIYTYYGNLSSSIVSVGDTVYQGQSIGLSTDTLQLKIKVGGELKDVSKLFKEAKQ